MLLTLIIATAVAAEETPTSEGLEAEIEALRVEKVAWRQLPWRSCLLRGLADARELKRPVILWVFIDRPIDDKRC